MSESLSQPVFSSPGMEFQIAIVGMNGRFPNSPTLEQWWRNLCEGVELISFFSDGQLVSAGREAKTLDDPAYVKAAAVVGGDEIKRFDASFFGFSPREAELMDPQHRMFLECAWHALENAGYSPNTLEGRVGVYAGQTVSSYWLQNVFLNPDIGDAKRKQEAGAGSAHDFLATRVSYKLNLKGPAITVQTACSTSLVAVHLACQSLLSGECDMALAGGVSLAVPQASGYWYQEGGILSPDGHCRVFDAKAQGTVPGSGAGIVVLRRLKDALDSGDNVIAIIRGSAINNDGGLKVSFTAPGIDGQFEAISEALAIAGVRPESITYVEAHGTGTALGDPAEIAALTKAFGPNSKIKQWCAIGSVKSNMGHLDVAAGVAGLMKTALQLQHAQIVPTLHFEEPNPKIDFPKTPFYVSTKLRQWNGGLGPRRAGVSSFGMGGTNAHVILEEALPAMTSEAARGWELLVVSAKTAAALERAAADFANYLRNTTASLADIAWTTHVGRAAFPHRRAVVCQNADSGARLFEKGDRSAVWNGVVSTTKRPVTFLFPGQGSQYLGMGRELYESEPTFRAEVDGFSELFRPHLNGRRLQDILYPTPERAPEAGRDLTQTAIAQPALCVIEYALARLWMEWGVKPESMIGHSIGEYVAACLAGVLTQEDTAQLVAARGELMQRMPAGAMLALETSEPEATELARGRLSVAAVNAPRMCVLSGSCEAIDELEQELRRRNLSYRRLRTSHAFHSQMMDPVLEQFAQVLKKVRLSPPSIPYVSNVTGTWIRPDQATAPGYWVTHLRHCVRFADGIGELLAQEDRILLELGPGQSLAALSRRHPRYTKERAICSSMRTATEQRSDIELIETTLARLWTAGVELDWKGFHSRERRRRVPLPGYPFERQAYWIEPRPSQANQALEFASDRLEKKPDPAEWFYTPSWRRTAPPTALRPIEPACWLLLVDDCGVGEAMANALRQRGHDVFTIAVGQQFAQVDRAAWVVNPSRSEDYKAALRQVRQTGREPRFIVHLWCLTPALETPLNGELRRQMLDRGFFSIVSIAQAIRDSFPSTRVQLSVVSDHIHDVTGEEQLCPEKATVLGPCLVIPQEDNNFLCRAIDLDTRHLMVPEETAERLITEMEVPHDQGWVALRGAYRWVQEFERLKMVHPQPDARRLRERGVYLITGGLGNIGLALAEHLARTCHARLVLLGRSDFPERREWDCWLGAHNSEDSTSAKIKILRRIEGAGAEILIVRADVADLAELQHAVEKTMDRFGALHGVIHGAGNLVKADMNYAQGLDRESSERQFHPKVQGTLVLEQVLHHLNLDFCLLLSSLSSVLGGLTFAAYSAANIFMDVFVRAHNKNSRVRWTAINWESWKFTELDQGIGAGLMALAVTPAEGVDAFERILARSGLDQFVVSTSDLRARLSQWVTAFDGRQETSPEPVLAPTYPRPDLQTEYVGPRSAVDHAVIRVWQHRLGIENIGIHDDFFDLGGDSLIAMKVLADLRETLKTGLPLQKFFEATTVAQLSDAIIAREPSAGWTERVVCVPAIVESPLEQSAAMARQERV